MCGSQCAKSDDDFHSLRGIACEGHTHTQTHTQTRTHTHTHTHILEVTSLGSLMMTFIFREESLARDTHTHTHTHTRTRTRTRTRKRTHAHANTRKHTQTHANTHTLEVTSLGRCFIDVEAIESTAAEVAWTCEPPGVCPLVHWGCQGAPRQAGHRGRRVGRPSRREGSCQIQIITSSSLCTDLFIVG